MAQGEIAPITTERYEFLLICKSVILQQIDFLLAFRYWLRPLAVADTKQLKPCNDDDSL